MSVPIGAAPNAPRPVSPPANASRSLSMRTSAPPPPAARFGQKAPPPSASSSARVLAPPPSAVAGRHSSPPLQAQAAASHAPTPLTLDGAPRAATPSRRPSMYGGSLSPRGGAPPPPPNSIQRLRAKDDVISSAAEGRGKSKSPPPSARPRPNDIAQQLQVARPTTPKRRAAPPPVASSISVDPHSNNGTPSRHSTPKRTAPPPPPSAPLSHTSSFHPHHSNNNNNMTATATTSTPPPPPRCVSPRSRLMSPSNDTWGPPPPPSPRGYYSSSSHSLSAPRSRPQQEFYGTAPPPPPMVIHPNARSLSQISSAEQQQQPWIPPSAAACSATPSLPTSFVPARALEVPLHTAAQQLFELDTLLSYVVFRQLQDQEPEVWNYFLQLIREDLVAQWRRMPLTSRVLMSHPALAQFSEQNVWVLVEPGVASAVTLSFPPTPSNIALQSVRHDDGSMVMDQHHYHPSSSHALQYPSALPHSTQPVAVLQDCWWPVNVLVGLIPHNAAVDSSSNKQQQQQQQQQPSNPYGFQLLLEATKAEGAPAMQLSSAIAYLERVLHRQAGSGILKPLQMNAPSTKTVVQPSVVTPPATTETQLSSQAAPPPLPLNSSHSAAAPLPPPAPHLRPTRSTKQLVAAPQTPPPSPPPSSATPHYQQHSNYPLAYEQQPPPQPQHHQPPSYSVYQDPEYARSLVWQSSPLAEHATPSTPIAVRSSVSPNRSRLVSPSSPQPVNAEYTLSQNRSSNSSRIPSLVHVQREYERGYYVMTR